MDQNANQLWSVLVCKPWLIGEFGSTTCTTGKGAKPTLVLLIAITLITLRLGFLLLLVAGPFFPIVGTHPALGRVGALR